MHPEYQAQCLGNLAIYLPSEQKKEALELVTAPLPGITYRATALCNLIPARPLTQLEQALEIAKECVEFPTLITPILQASATRLAQLQTDDTTRTPLDTRACKKKLLDILREIPYESQAEKDKTAILTALIPSLDNNEL